MKYIKTHVKIHLKYWYVNLFLPITYLLSLSAFLVSWILSGMGIKGEFPIILGFLIGSFIFCLPVFFTNYKVASEIQKNNKIKIKFSSLLLLNYFPSWSILTTIYVILFKLLIGTISNE